MTHTGTRGFYSQRRHYAYAVCNAAEHAMLQAQAKKEGLSISNFVRRCVNSYLLELGDDVVLLEEYHPRGRTPRVPSLGHSGRRPDADRWPKGSL